MSKYLLGPLYTITTTPNALSGVNDLCSCTVPLVFVWEWVDLLCVTVAQKQIWTYRSVCSCSHVTLCCQVYVVASSLSSTCDLFICLSLPPAVFLFTRYFGRLSLSFLLLAFCSCSQHVDPDGKDL